MPEHIVVPGLAVTFTVGVTLGSMVIVTLLDTEAGVAQAELLVMVHFTISPLFRLFVLYVGVLPGTGLAFTYH